MKVESTIFSVSQYINYVNLLVSLEPVLVEGEVSNFREIPGRNFCYFDIKDENAVARCFQGFWKSNKVVLENGAKIQVFGNPSMQKNGTFVIDVLEVLLCGKGALMEAYNKLKKQLQEEGLFDLEFKKRLPVFPRKIGLIAGKNSSAYQDVVSEVMERWGGSDLFFLASKVQGVGAKQQITQAIRHFNQKFPVDVLVIARGGGSAEDLQAFDSEEVVREIFASKIPVISAIGHEDHWTLSDFVADVRAKTPTKAGQLAVPDRRELENKIKDFQSGAVLSLKHKIENFEFMLEGAEREIRTRVLSGIEGYSSEAEMVAKNLKQAIVSVLDKKLDLLEQFERSLNIINPDRVLERGYCMIEKNGQRVKSVLQLRENEKFRGKLRDGEFTGKIENIMQKFTKLS